MTHEPEYFLINETCGSCEQCLLLTHAFLLIQLPIKPVNLTELSYQLATKQKHMYVFYCCNTLVNTENLLPLQHVSWISFRPELQSNTVLKEHTSFLPFPFSFIALQNLLHSLKQHHSNCDFSDPVFESLIGASKEILHIKQMIKQVATRDTQVLIMGESGTGKEVVASCIHALSLRNNKAFVPINCGAIPSELIESELFGHEKGAFTGAGMKRTGRFEMAHQGTLFLDEIGDMPFNMQVKLLRAIQERKIERIGSNLSIDVDVRIISATNKNLSQLVEDKLFREDLFYRLNVFPIILPNLSSRKEDIPLLIEFYINKIAQRLNASIAFSQNVIEILCEYPWPGNIRELMNFLERKIVLYANSIVTENELSAHYRTHKS